jgi:hypothetical protein
MPRRYELATPLHLRRPPDVSLRSWVCPSQWIRLHRCDGHWREGVQRWKRLQRRQCWKTVCRVQSLRHDWIASTAIDRRRSRQGTSSPRQGAAHSVTSAHSIPGSWPQPAARLPDAGPLPAARAMGGSPARCAARRHRSRAMRPARQTRDGAVWALSPARSRRRRARLCVWRQ